MDYDTDTGLDENVAYVATPKGIALGLMMGVEPDDNQPDDLFDDDDDDAEEGELEDDDATIEGLSEDEFHALLCAVTNASGVNLEIPAEVDARLQAAIDGMGERPRSVLERGATGSKRIARMAEAEAGFRLGKKTNTDHLHRTLEGMSDSQLRAIGGLESAEQGDVDQLSAGMTSRQRALLAAAVAPGTSTITTAARAHFMYRKQQAVPRE